MVIEKFGDGAAEHNSFRGAGSVELPAAGLGSLNYLLYVELLAKNHPNIPLYWRGTGNRYFLRLHVINGKGSNKVNEFLTKAGYVDALLFLLRKCYGE